MRSIRSRLTRWAGSAGSWCRAARCDHRSPSQLRRWNPALRTCRPGLPPLPQVRLQATTASQKSLRLCGHRRRSPGTVPVIRYARAAGRTSSPSPPSPQPWSPSRSAGPSSGAPARQPRGPVASGTLEFETTLRAPAGKGEATAAVRGILTGTGRTVQLRTDDLAVLPKGEFYELWFVGADDAPRSPDRISAGTFHPTRTGDRTST